MQKKVNGMTIQVEWLYRRHSTAQSSKLNGYAEEIQRHKKTFNGITIQVAW